MSGRVIYTLHRLSYLIIVINVTPFYRRSKWETEGLYNLLEVLRHKSQVTNHLESVCFFFLSDSAVLFCSDFFPGVLKGSNEIIYVRTFYLFWHCPYSTNISLVLSTYSVLQYTHMHTHMPKDDELCITSCWRVLKSWRGDTEIYKWQ